MAHNSLAPGFIKLYYIQNLITHVQTIPVVPSGVPIPGAEPNLLPVTGSPVTMSQFITDYMVVFRPLFSSLTTVVNAEFWSKPTPESDPVWIYDIPINLPGTTGATTTSMGQFVISFRTSLGGLFKLYIMEPSSPHAINTRVSGSALTGVDLALSNYVKGATSCFRARDDGKLIVPIFYTSKLNDALRKRRLLL